MIAENKRRYTDFQHALALVDISSDRLPEGDLLICRDCLFHLSYKDTFAFLSNFVSSASLYLLTNHDAVAAPPGSPLPPPSCPDTATDNEQFEIGRRS